MRRVVITGLGMVTPLACGVEATWQGIVAGKSGIKHVDAFDVFDIACHHAGFLLDLANDGVFERLAWFDETGDRRVPTRRP